MSKRNLLKAQLGLALILSVMVTSYSLGDVVIGDWENSTDGWIDWGTQAALTAPKYTYSSFGATHGSSAIKVTQASYNQNLAIKLQDNNLKDAFFANQQFSIDFSVPDNAVAGYEQIFDLAINAQDYGFVSQGSVPKFTYGFPNGGAQTTTVTWDYSTLVDGNTANGEISPAATYVEFIIATNSDATHGEFYFDNARLSRIVGKGDFNHNGVLDAPDIDLLFQAQQGEVPFVDGQYDVNNDGVVTTGVAALASDTDYWVQTLAATRYGDANVDKKVDFNDLLALAKNYNTSADATWSMGNFNGDGAVNFSDLLLLAKNYGFVATADLSSLDPAVAADWALAQSLVPEPASLGALLVAASLMRRRRH